MGSLHRLPHPRLGPLRLQLHLLLHLLLLLFHFSFSSFLQQRTYVISGTHCDGPVKTGGGLLPLSTTFALPMFSMGVPFAATILRPGFLGMVSAA